MRKKNLDKIDWVIHAVYDDKENQTDFEMHTHGLEKHGVRNICMECPSRDLVEYCATFINNLAQSMIRGEKYQPGKTQLIDNEHNYDEVYDVFDIDIDRRDNGEGEEEVYVIRYWFYSPFINPVNKYLYKFHWGKKEWIILGR